MLKDLEVWQTAMPPNPHGKASNEKTKRVHTIQDNDFVCVQRDFDNHAIQHTLSYTRLIRRGTQANTVGFNAAISFVNNFTLPWKKPILKNNEIKSVINHINIKTHR